MKMWARSLVLVAGLMGTAGVGIAAAGTHAGGGDLARLAAEFLLIHASVVVCLGLSVASGLRPPVPWLIAATALAAGAIVFSGDIAVIGFFDARPVPLAAPVGGFVLIMGWLAVVLSAALQIRGQEPR